ncbi:MAG: hypothetical protein RLZZ65_1102 [Bacteroidota bacterium]|jgi:glycosyltransferase involved in cell wall biosynthesis
MKILIISHKPPYPSVDGGCLAMARLLEDTLALPTLSQLDYFCLSTQKHPFDSTAFPTHEKLRVFEQQIDTRVHPLGALTALLKQESYNLSRFYQTEVAQKIIALCKATTYDFIIFESLFTAVYAKTLRPHTAAKLIYRSHNIEHQIWKDLARSTRNLLKRWYLQQLAYTLKWAERSIWSEDQGCLNLILSISMQDALMIEGQTLTSIKYLPASIPESALESTLETKKLCFIGAFDWQPNIASVDWLIKYVLPKLVAKHPEVQLHIAGRNSDQIQRWQQPNVVCHGFVPDSKAFIANHGVFVSGLQAGSGVKMKVLEALSVGAPMVLTAKSAEGLSHFDYKNLHQFASSFIEECLMLIEDPEKRSQDAAANKQYYSAHFAPQKVQSELQHILQQL